jgi:hypothetical protein
MKTRLPRLPTGKHKGNKKSRLRDFAKIDLFFHIKKKKKNMGNTNKPPEFKESIYEEDSDLGSTLYDINHKYIYSKYSIRDIPNANHTDFEHLKSDGRFKNIFNNMHKKTPDELIKLHYLCDDKNRVCIYNGMAFLNKKKEDSVYVSVLYEKK